VATRYVSRNWVFEETANILQALSQAPQLKEFVEIVHERGDDAQKLAEETYNDIKKVLEKRLDEAKKLSKK
jgi:hypothetical protein